MSASAILTSGAMFRRVQEVSVRATIALHLVVLVGAVLICFFPAAQPVVNAASYYVASDGDNGNDGSASNPWATISYGLEKIEGGDEILVDTGTYYGNVTTDRSFDEWITIRSVTPYHAKLTNVDGGGPAVSIYTKDSAKIIIEGFVISNAHPSYECMQREEQYLIHVQDAQDVTLHNNIIYGNNAPGTCNELLKINRGGDPYYPKNILIVGNVFYDRADAAGTDMIDAVRPGDLDIKGNIFFSRAAQSAQSFITLKRQVDAASLGVAPRSPRYVISGNVFLNWSGKSDQAFIQLGEDDTASYQITDALIENNLLIGNSDNPIVAAIQLKGVRDIVVRANTVTGNLPGSAYGFRIGTEGSNPQSMNIRITNNIWSDPTGTMGQRFINTYGDVDLASIVLLNNLYFNGGNVLPDQEIPRPTDDPRGIVADPGLRTDQSEMVLPVWDDTKLEFASGAEDIASEFSRLVNAYGSVTRQSAAIDKADPFDMPNHDILGNSRDDAPDIGAFEFPGAFNSRGAATAWMRLLFGQDAE